MAPPIQLGGLIGNRESPGQIRTFDRYVHVYHLIRPLFEVFRYYTPFVITFCWPSTLSRCHHWDTCYVPIVVHCRHVLKAPCNTFTGKRVAGKSDITRGAYSLMNCLQQKPFKPF